ncbi:penicillin acylase family protein [Natronospirillum operosum]|uniref:penicillin acylase family protein n=1 Tax=Natronospirillum operosum TaxID=2759953 RepID=UPI001F0FC59E|nr:penicillin acylase family protein [Natronospirillum operosum]
MKMGVRRLGRWAGSLLLLLLVLVVAGTGFIYWQLAGSLAQLDGEVRHAALQDAVRIDRDAQGIPMITATDRADSAFALGFLHAQERYFQMDLLRRNSAGELAGLFGAAGLDHDRSLRRHQFRQRAEAALDTLPEAQRHLLDRYVEGVNAGLQELRSQPFEYWLLGTEPESWQAEDTYLALYSMYLDLQPNWAQQEVSRATMRDLLPADWFDFLQPDGGEWDAPLQGEARTFDAPIPEQSLNALAASTQGAPENDTDDWQYQDPIAPGSNNWSVGGGLTEDGTAMLANDMHLGLAVPNIWYRASWVVPAADRVVSGATLPGAPAMVVGSNEHIAWGFTNSFGDYHDVIVLQTRNNDTEYRTPDGWAPIEVVTEQIAVQGEDDYEHRLRRTHWGPVVGRDHQGRLLVMRWVAHDPEGANLNHLLLESASSVEEALPIAQASGIPTQNMLVADRHGDHAWTLMGRIPRRFGDLDGREPADWSDGTRGWDGYLAPEDYPVLRPAQDDRLWSANARVVTGDWLQLVGQGYYALGARQQQIRDSLQAADRFTEADFLALQLDDRALLMRRWRELLLDVLADAEETALLELRAEVEAGALHAAADDVGYRIVRRWREQIIDGTTGVVFRHLRAQAGSAFQPGWVSHRLEYPAWALVSTQPEHQVPAPHASWPEFLLAVARDIHAELTADDATLAEQTWGEFNRAHIVHPLAAEIPVLGRFLRMPDDPLSGDWMLPRVQSPHIGASQRLVVRPGQEAEAIFHMATGQSGHPLSPFFDSGHRDWVEGRPSPLLPGDAAYQLYLLPAGD